MFELKVDWYGHELKLRNEIRKYRLIFTLDGLPVMPWDYRNEMSIKDLREIEAFAQYPENPDEFDDYWKPGWILYKDNTLEILRWPQDYPIDLPQASRIVSELSVYLEKENKFIDVDVRYPHERRAKPNKTKTIILERNSLHPYLYNFMKLKSVDVAVYKTAKVVLDSDRLFLANVFESGKMLWLVGYIGGLHRIIKFRNKDGGWVNQKYMLLKQDSQYKLIDRSVVISTLDF